MHINANSLNDLCQYINVDTIVITPNRRLSATLHKMYQEYEVKNNQQCWATPCILPLTTWIQYLWDHFTSQQFALFPQLLNPMQEQYAWESILSIDERFQFLQTTETAQLARSAWNLIKQWQVNIDLPIFQSCDDYTALYFWNNQFQEYLQKNNWTDIGSVTDLIIKRIELKEIIPHKKIILIGFNEESPQLANLLNACEKVGSHCLRFELKNENTICQRIDCIDQEQEILSMARWAKMLWDNHPLKTIGCVIPSLDKIRDRVLQLFTEVFSEKNIYPFNISAGKSLIQYPIIHAAMQLLFLHKNRITIDKFSYILTTPFVGGAETERYQRAYFETQLRKNNIHSINIIESAQLSLLTKTCPILAKQIKLFYTEIPQDKNLSYAEWMNCFNHLLSILGWPGERSLNSEEFQIVESWLNVLNECKTLDYLSQPVNYYQALQTLQKLLSQTVFQVKTPDAPIQILGVLEASTLPFDYLWVSGMDDMSWPPKAKPHPLIPKKIQRELHMPHATSERELFYCKQLTQSFKYSAPTVIFSYANKIEEIELQPSPLIRDIPASKIEDLNLENYHSVSEKIFASKKIEWITDEIAPKLGDNEKIYGGISILQQQALCPFKAFAEWRLHAKELETSQPGLRAKERGTILHKTIEILWNQINNHATLIAMETHKLHDIINQSINDALKILNYASSSQYIALEKKRINQLLIDWLAIEKVRSPFTVLSHEKTNQITLNQLTLNIRIDRIDELENGKKLVIDYKTGKNNDISHWFSERPEQPQLPLYALLDRDNTIGIAFAQIFPGENYFKGISQNQLDIKGIKLISEIKKATVANWNEQINEWHNILTKLSDDFYMGNAKVDPKQADETCRFCGLKPLCRVNEEHDYH